MNFIDIFQALLDFIGRHKSEVLLLSIVFTLLPWLVMFSLLRRFKIRLLNKWAKPFAWAFFILALLHILSLVGWILGTRPPYLVYGGAICSAGSTYFLLRVGAALMRDKLSSKLLKTIHNNGTVISASVLIIALATTLLPPSEAWWSRLPDVLLSTFAIVLVGYALYRNISFRRGQLVSVIALLSAIIYGVLFLSYSLHPKIAETELVQKMIKISDQNKLASDKTESETRIRLMDTFVIAMSLPVKLGLFFPAYVLVLMIAGPARIRQLYEKVTEGPENFLDNNGVVLAMKKEIKADLVEMYIKLPREEKDQAACYRSKALMQAGGNPEELTFDKTTDFGQVLYSGQCILHRVINYPDEFPEGWEQDYSKISSVIVLPIIFHSTVVGCLRVELDSGNFTEADMQNMQRFASLLSPMVQEYREADGLNEISRRLTRLQIKAEEYKIPKGIDEIAEISCETLAAPATSISLEGGFYLYDNMDVEKSHDPITQRLRDELPAELEPIYRDGKFIYLPEKLIIAYNTKEAAGGTDGAEGEQFFGRYVLKSPSTSDKNNLPTLATKPIHRRAVSNLIMEAMLNQVRGSLNEVSRKLAVRLNSLKKADESGEIGPAKQDSIQRWLEIVEAAAGEAGLRWVVATHPKAKGAWLGQEHELVRELEEDKSRWITKVPYKAYAEIEAIGICKLEPPRSGTTHVIKLSFSEPAQQMWLGVCNPNFGQELDYLSPWSGFVHRFGEIAHTALQQILRRQAREEEIAKKARRRQIEDSKFERASISHRMAGLVANVVDQLEMVIDVVRSLKGEKYEGPKRMTHGLMKDVTELKKLSRKFADVGKHSASRSCRLQDIVQHALKDMQDKLATYDFAVDFNDLETHTVGVSLDVAQNALIVLLENAIEAPRDETAQVGWIRIIAEKKGETLLCHVKDNGTGIPPHIIPDIFDKQVVSTKRGGSGIGLYQSSDYLRQYDSDIKLTCKGPDPSDPIAKTTFTLCFPSSSEDSKHDS